MQKTKQAASLQHSCVSWESALQEGTAARTVKLLPLNSPNSEQVSEDRENSLT